MTMVHECKTVRPSAWSVRLVWWDKTQNFEKKMFILGFRHVRQQKNLRLVFTELIWNWFGMILWYKGYAFTWMTTLSSTCDFSSTHYFQNLACFGTLQSMMHAAWYSWEFRTEIMDCPLVGLVIMDSLGVCFIESWFETVKMVWESLECAFICV